MEVRVKGSLVDFELVSMGNGVYKITVANAGKIEAKDQVEVTLKAGAAVTSVPNAPIKGEAKLEEKAPVTSEEAKMVGDITVAVGTPKTDLYVTVIEGDSATRKAGEPLKNLVAADFTVTVDGTKVTDLNVSPYNIGINGYKLSADSVSEWDGSNIKNIVVTVGTHEETFNTVAQGSPAITVANENATYEMGSVDAGDFTTGELTLTNINMGEITASEVKINDGLATPEQTKQITVQKTSDGKIAASVAADLMNQIQKGKTLTFKLTDGKVTSDKAITITAQQATAKVTAGTFTLLGNTIELTLENKPSAYMKKKLEDTTKWTTKVDSNSVFTAGQAAPAVTSVAVDADKKKVALTLGEAASDVTYHAAGNVQAEKTVAFTDQSVAVTMTGNIAVSKVTLGEVQIAEAIEKKTEIKVNFGLTKAVADKLVEEVKKGTIGNLFEVKTGASDSAINTGNAVTDATVAEDGTVTLTLTTALNKGEHISFEFKTGTDSFNAKALVKAQITNAQ